MEIRRKHEDQISRLDRDLSIYKVVIEQAEGVIQNLQTSKADLEVELELNRQNLL
jgi:hypothetical protein